jgi:hypothetical protein
MWSLPVDKLIKIRANDADLRKMIQSVRKNWNHTQIHVYITKNARLATKWAAESHIKLMINRHFFPSPYGSTYEEGITTTRTMIDPGELWFRTSRMGIAISAPSTAEWWVTANHAAIYLNSFTQDPSPALDVARDAVLCDNRLEALTIVQKELPFSWPLFMALADHEKRRLNR